MFARGLPEYLWLVICHLPMNEVAFIQETRLTSDLARETILFIQLQVCVYSVDVCLALAMFLLFSTLSFPVIFS